MLVAHPQTISTMKNLRLNQIEASEFGQFMQNGLLVKNNCFKGSAESNMIQMVYKKMEILEMEGKFEVRRPKS